MDSAKEKADAEAALTLARKKALMELTGIDALLHSPNPMMVLLGHLCEESVAEAIRGIVKQVGARLCIYVYVCMVYAHWCEVVLYYVRHSDVPTLVCVCAFVICS